jgi:feruloyl esterase
VKKSHFPDLTLIALGVAGVVVSISEAQRPPGPGICENLASLRAANTRITAAQTITTGSFTLPTGVQSPLTGLRPFCRIAATLTPTSDSDIKIEVWMPVSGWNGKFQAVGNGGWSGAIAYSAMAAALASGYATSSTDTGHAGSSASFALGHPEKLIDFGYRSVHEMTVTAKALIKAFYGDAPKLSYWRGCSAGGRQGLKEAQQFPADYDGIIAGAPAADWTGRASTAMRIALAVHRDAASYLPREKYALLHTAVLDRCDTLDGVKDGVLENPRRCTFDPAVLECKGADGSSCLTSSQVAAARQIYSAATNPRTQREITGLEPGSELGWATWGGAQPFAIGLEHFRYVVFRDPNWDFRQFNFGTDVVKAEETDAGTINALDPNLRAFFTRGGKLLQYHGWSDPQISPGNSVQYYQRVSEGDLDRFRNSYRLFMVPGMAHCSGGDGTSTFDVVSALEHWVESGAAPDRIEASRVRDGKIDRTRPLCPFPQIATYRGTGSTDDASNFACTIEASHVQ